MIKKWNEFIREFVNEPINVDYINARMKELSDVTDDLNVFEWSIDEKSSYEDGDVPLDSQGQLNISFIVGNLHNEEFIKFEFDLDELRLEKIVDEDEVKYSERVSSIEEGLDIIEKEIYKYIGISESFEDNELTGKRVRIVRLEDPYTRLKPGDEGTVRGVDDMGHVLMSWDNGESLSMIPELDEFDVIDENLNESKIFDHTILPKDALKELVDGYATIGKDKIEVYPDPQVEGTYAIQVNRDGYVFHLLWNRGGMDEVEFEQFPPKSGKNLNFLW